MFRAACNPFLALGSGLTASSPEGSSASAAWTKSRMLSRGWGGHTFTLLLPSVQNTWVCFSPEAAFSLYARYYIRHFIYLLSRRAWQPTPVFLPGESHGQRSLAGCSPCGHKESDTTEGLTTTQHILLSFTPCHIPK